jgi:hypothetical protein
MNRKSHCRLIKAAINKYGWERMVVEKLATGIPREALNELEVKLIAEHNTLHPNGYNQTPGGDINPMLVPEVYARVKAMHEAGEIKPKQLAGFTPEVRAKMSASQKKRAMAVPEEERKRESRRRLAKGNATAKSNEPQVMLAKVETWDNKVHAKHDALGLSDAQRVKAWNDVLSRRWSQALKKDPNAPHPGKIRVGSNVAGISSKIRRLREAKWGKLVYGPRVQPADWVSDSDSD